MPIMTLLSAQTTNVSTAPEPLNFPDKQCLVKVWGTWNGASISLQTFTPGGTTYPLDIYDEFGNAFTFTADRQIMMVNFVYNEPITAILSSAGASTSLNVTLQDI